MERERQRERMYTSETTDSIPIQIQIRNEKLNKHKNSLRQHIKRVYVSSSSNARNNQRSAPGWWGVPAHRYYLPSSSAGAAGAAVSVWSSTSLPAYNLITFCWNHSSVKWFVLIHYKFPFNFSISLFNPMLIHAIQTSTHTIQPSFHSSFTHSLAYCLLQRWWCFLLNKFSLPWFDSHLHSARSRILMRLMMCWRGRIKRIFIHAVMES